jgi:hypothetical protein
MGKLDDLLRQTSEAGEAVALKRAEASESVVNVIRTLERKLIDALDGECLRGLVSLAGAPGGRDRFYGAQLVSNNIDLPLNDRAVLCVDKSGEFVIARRFDGVPYWAARPVMDLEIRVEWLGLVTQSLQKVLERHIARSARTEANYRATAELAEKLARNVA